MNDKLLIEKLKSSPSEGMEIAVRKYSALVYFILQGKLSGILNKEELSELCSDVFTEFYLSLDRFDVKLGTVKAYLCRIAKNTASDRYSEYMKSVSDISLDSDEFPKESYADEFSVEEALIDEEFRQKLLSEIKALGEPDCEIIIRKFYLGEPSKSIAAALGLTVTNIDVRTHRALEKLRCKLSEYLN